MLAHFSPLSNYNYQSQNLIFKLWHTVTEERILISTFCSRRKAWQAFNNFFIILEQRKHNEKRCWTIQICTHTHTVLLIVLIIHNSSKTAATVYWFRYTNAHTHTHTKWVARFHKQSFDATLKRMLFILFSLWIWFYICIGL